MSAASDETAHERVLRRSLDRVGRRMRLHVALRAAERAAWGLGLVALLLVVATRLSWMHARTAWQAFALAVGLAAAAIFARARAVATSEAAARADEALGLFDRLTSAVVFLDETAPTPLMLLAIEDGARVSASIDASRVVALSLPRSARALPLLAIAIGAACLLRPPRPAVVARTAVETPRLVVERDALEAERAALRKTARDAGTKDPAMAQLAEALDKILDEIDRQQLSRQEAFDKLAALEAKVNAQMKAAPPPKKELEALQKALATSKETKPIADALKQEDLDAARQALEKLAAEAEARARQSGADESDESRSLQRALDRASKALDEAQKKADAERDKQIEALKEEERRLRREHEAHPDDEETERRLQRNQRELERLEREKQQREEQRRQLQRLSRELEKAAEELRQKMSPEAMKRAAEELAKMEDEIKKLGSSAQQQMQIVELKEVLRRAGRVEQGNGNGQQNGQGQGGQGQGRPGQARGQDKNGGKGQDGRDEQLREFDQRAGGEPNALILGGDDPGQGSVMLPLPLGNRGDDPGGGGDEPGDQHGGHGDDIGKEHDPNLTGDPTHLDAHKKLIHATGQAGAGPSRSQTILGASERGFSSRDYSRVYKDYTSVVEEVMSQERVPPGYRYYVKRYFQLIRPRE